MPCVIETRQEPNGRWVASVPEVPDLMVFGDTQEEARTLAQNVAALIIDWMAQNNETIPALHPAQDHDTSRTQAAPTQ